MLFIDSQRDFLWPIKWTKVSLLFYVINIWSLYWEAGTEIVFQLKVKPLKVLTFKIRSSWMYIPIIKNWRKKKKEREKERTSHPHTSFFFFFLVITILWNSLVTNSEIYWICTDLETWNLYWPLNNLFSLK